MFNLPKIIMISNLALVTTLNAAAPTEREEMEAAMNRAAAGSPAALAGLQGALQQAGRWIEDAEAEGNAAAAAVLSDPEALAALSANINRVVTGMEYSDPEFIARAYEGMGLPPELAGFMGEVMARVDPEYGSLSVQASMRAEIANRGGMDSFNRSMIASAGGPDLPESIMPFMGGLVSRAIHSPDTAEAAILAATTVVPDAAAHLLATPEGREAFLDIAGYSGPDIPAVSGEPTPWPPAPQRSSASLFNTQWPLFDTSMLPEVNAAAVSPEVMLENGKALSILENISLNGQVSRGSASIEQIEKILNQPLVSKEIRHIALKYGEWILSNHYDGYVVEKMAYALRGHMKDEQILGLLGCYRINKPSASKAHLEVVDSMIDFIEEHPRRVA